MFVATERLQPKRLGPSVRSGGESGAEEDMVPSHSTLEAMYALEDAIRAIEEDPMFGDAGMSVLPSEDFASTSNSGEQLWDHQELQWLSSDLSIEIEAVSLAAHH